MLFGIISAYFIPDSSHAELRKMKEEELADITGTGAVDFSVIGNTARIYFDVHIETYAEIDSLKLGYYYKENLTTRKYLAPDDPQVTDNGDGTFTFTHAVTGEVVSNQEYYNYTDDNGDDHAIPYIDNDDYQYKYKNHALMGEFYVDGRQGLNDKSVMGEEFSSAPSQNQNYMDWDINLENIRLGESADNPAVIDGLIIHVKYDDINDVENRKITDIIIGTNSYEGDFYADMIRSTGYYNPKLAHEMRCDNALLNDPTIESFNEAPVAVSLQRDSFLMLVDHYNFQYDDPDDGNTPPHPEDPTNNNIHTGMFLRLGLDPTSPNFGFALVAGYNEIVANAYQPSSSTLKNDISDWWN